VFEFLFVANGVARDLVLPGDSIEPPGEPVLSVVEGDPHAGWCVGWGIKTPGYPIG